ncbi:hypothetical protein M0802_006922 [Mischocyttarus mexicanus]|nr:hypothetical protein M0802_006922 [Mischocyttarus mexicanus]
MKKLRLSSAYSSAAAGGGGGGGGCGVGCGAAAGASTAGCYVQPLILIVVIVIVEVGSSRLVARSSRPMLPFRLGCWQCSGPGTAAAVTLTLTIARLARFQMTND